MMCAILSNHINQRTTQTAHCLTYVVLISCYQRLQSESGGAVPKYKDTMFSIDFCPSFSTGEVL